jgi:hypothetical protein
MFSWNDSLPYGYPQWITLDPALKCGHCSLGLPRANGWGLAASDKISCHSKMKPSTSSCIWYSK